MDKDLRLAVVRGALVKVTSLLKGVTTLPDSDRTPSLIAEALSRGHIAIASLLLERDAKPSAAEGGTLLVNALKGDAAQIIEPLLASLGPRAAAAVREHVREWTPLMHAAKAGQLSAIKALLQAGADVDARMTRHGGTALMIAVQHTQAEAVEALLDAGASIDATDAQGWTALQWAAQIGAVPPIARLLAHLESTGSASKGVSAAMMVAVENGHFDAAVHLLEAGADPEVTDTQGWTALVIAAAAGHQTIVGRLLEAGASVRACTQPSGRTPVMAAAQAGHLAALSLLIAADGCDEALLSTADANGTTALMLAAKNGHAPVVRALLAARCEPHTTDSAGARTAPPRAPITPPITSPAHHLAHPSPHPPISVLGSLGWLASSPALGASLAGLVPCPASRARPAALQGELSRERPASSPALPLGRAL